MSSFKKASKCNQKTHRERAQVRLRRDDHVADWPAWFRCVQLPKITENKTKNGHW